MIRELAQMTFHAKPTPFHHMLASLASEGRLMRLYSQNIDTLDTQMPPLETTVPLHAKGPWPTTIQLHGGLGKMVCTKCGHLEPLNASLFEGPEPPLCEKCKEQDQVRTTAGKRSHGIGRLRPRIVLYDENNPDGEAIGMVSKADLRRVPDAVIVVGTSLKIPGVRRIVKEMCQLTRSRRDGITAWINLDPEPQGIEFKDCWDLVVRGKCDEIAGLVNLPRWDQQDVGDRESYHDGLTLLHSMGSPSQAGRCGQPRKNTLSTSSNLREGTPARATRPAPHGYLIRPNPLSPGFSAPSFPPLTTSPSLSYRIPAPATSTRDTMESYVFRDGDLHPFPNPEPHRDVNELAAIAGNIFDLPRQGDTRPRTKVPSTHERLAKPRAKTLDALRGCIDVIDLTEDGIPSLATALFQRTARETLQTQHKARTLTIIDLTGDDTPILAAARLQTMAPDMPDRAQHKARSPEVIDLTDDGSPSPAATRLQTKAPDTPDRARHIAGASKIIDLIHADDYYMNGDGRMYPHFVAGVAPGPSNGYADEDVIKEQEWWGFE